MKITTIFPMWVNATCEFVVDGVISSVDIDDVSEWIKITLEQGKVPELVKLVLQSADLELVKPEAIVVEHYLNDVLERTKSITRGLACPS